MTGISWSDVAGLFAVAVIVVALVVLVRGRDLVSAWAQHAYEPDDEHS
jgi:hypothetical protein